MILTRLRILPHCCSMVIGAMLLAGCWPIYERQYNASLGPVHTVRPGMGCSVDGGVEIPLAHGIKMDVSPPLFAQKKGQEVTVGILLAAGHTAQFRDVVVRFESSSPAVSWLGTLGGSSRRTQEEHSTRVIHDHTAFDATAVMEGATVEPSRPDSAYESAFALTVVTDRPFPNEFAMQLPVLVFDGTDVQLPVVNIKFGHALGFCGCCGT